MDRVLSLGHRHRHCWLATRVRPGEATVHGWTRRGLCRLSPRLCSRTDHTCVPACSRLDHMRGSGSVAAVTDHASLDLANRLCMVCARSPRPDQLITRATPTRMRSQQLISPLHFPLGGRGHQPVPLRRTHSSSVRGVFFPLRSNRSGVPGVPLSLKLVNLKKQKTNTAFTL